MKNFITKLNNLKFFFISLVSTFVTFVINFFLLPVKPDYFICNNLKDYDFQNYNFQYPISCDQESYYSAIRDLSTLFNEGYVYQGRPLYILINSAIANFLNISTFGSVDNFDNVIHVSIIIFHAIVISISGYLFFKIFEEKIKDNFDLWEDDYPYNTEFGDGRTEEEMEAIDNRNEDEWRIKQYNRNRDAKDQVSTIEELNKRISDEVFNS